MQKVQNLLCLVCNFAPLRYLFACKGKVTACQTGFIALDSVVRILLVEVMGKLCFSILIGNSRKLTDITAEDDMVATAAWTALDVCTLKELQ